MLRVARIALAISFSVSLTSQAAYSNVAKQLMRLSPTLSRSTVNTLSMPLYNTRGFNSLPVIPGSRQKLYNSWRPVTLSLQSQSALNSSLNTYRSLTTWNKSTEKAESSQSSSVVSTSADCTHNSRLTSQSSHTDTQHKVLLAANFATAGVLSSDDEKDKTQMAAFFSVIDKILNKPRTVSEYTSIESEIKELEQYLPYVNKKHSEKDYFPFKWKHTSLEHTLKGCFDKPENFYPILNVASYLINSGAEVTLEALMLAVANFLNFDNSSEFLVEAWIKFFDDMLSKVSQTDRAAAILFFIQREEKITREDINSIKDRILTLKNNLSSSQILLDEDDDDSAEYNRLKTQSEKLNLQYRKLNSLESVARRYYQLFR